MSERWLASLDAWKTTEPPEPEGNRYAAEEAKEEAFAMFEQDVLEFAQKWGMPAAVRAVARVMEAQKTIRDWR
jgi:hypothetical protein